MIEVPFQTQTSLPQAWQLKPLSDVIEIRNGYAFKSGDFLRTGVLLIRQSNLTANGISINKPIYLPKPYLNKYTNYKLGKGDVLMGMSGSIGKLCVYDLDIPALQNQRTGLIEFIIPDYTEYVMCYLQYIESELLALAKGEAIKNISASQVKSFLIPLPPIDEAKRIASKIKPLLSELELATQKLTTAKANLNDYRKAVLQQSLYSKQCVKHVKLGKVAAIRNGYNFPFQYFKNNNKGMPFFKVADLAQTDGYGSPYLSDVNHYVSANSCYKHRLKPGFIIFAKTGEAIKLNRRAILKQAALIDNNMMGIFSTSNRLDNMYLYYLLLSIPFGNLGRATTVPSVRKSDIANITIPLPPVPEQRRIASEIEPCIAAASDLEKGISDNMIQASQLRQSIFKKAFAGKLIDN